MRRETEAVGQDSFLDVVANIVGILIILVMVAGMRMANASMEATPTPDFEEARRKLEQSLRTENVLKDETLDLAERIKSTAVGAEEQQALRDMLARRQVEWERRIAERKKMLGAQAQEAFDLNRDLDEAKRLLGRLQSEATQLASAKKAPTILKSHCTPMSRIVSGPEAHFRIAGGRISYIPLEDLLRELKSDVEPKLHRLQRQPSFTETLGPIGGYRLQYTIDRMELPVEVQMATGRTGFQIQFRNWTLLPMSPNLGEPVDKAHAPGSVFHEALSKYRAAHTTVTLWTYNDSFTEYRKVKDILFKLGFSTAGRPLPVGVPIQGSPSGTRSAAQ
jgi:hypothetical protein